MKKYVTHVLAALSVMGVLAGCTEQTNTPMQHMATDTNASAHTSDPADVPDDSFSKEDYEKLSALQFDDYRHMTVSEFQNKVWEMTDTPKYMELLERFFRSQTLYRKKDSDETAYFLFYVLKPLTAEDWQTQTYSGAAGSDLHASAENAELEYSFTLTILAADKVMVKDYNDMRAGVKDMMQDILRNRTKEELQNETFMQAELKTYVDEMLPYMQTPEVCIDLAYAYFPLPAENNKDPRGDFDGNTEHRSSPNGTEEDYRSLLLTLKTADDQKAPPAI